MRTLALVAALASLVSCHVEQAPSDFVPGQEMVFPLKSAGVAEDLIERLQVNCQSTDPNLTRGCNEMLRKRGAECPSQPPVVFVNKVQYSTWAEAYADCVFPDGS